MATGAEICIGCKRSPFPQGYEPTLKKCWSCTFPTRPLPLTEAQRAMIQEAWAK